MNNRDREILDIRYNPKKRDTRKTYVENKRENSDFKGMEVKKHEMAKKLIKQ